MITHHIEILLPLSVISVKPLLLNKICEGKGNIPKNYVVDEMAIDARYPEMVWSQLKHHARRLNNLKL